MKITEEEKLAGMEKALINLKGKDYDSLKFKIDILKRKIGNQFTNINMSINKLEGKLVREKNLQSGFNKIAAINKTDDLQEKLDFCKLKIYFLNKQMITASVVEDDNEQVIKTNGVLKMRITKIESDPAFMLTQLTIFVDSKIHKYKVKEQEVVLQFNNAREIEILLHATNTIVGFLFFPTEKLIRFDDEVLNFQDHILLHCKFQFEKQKRLQRKDAEIVAEQKKGHDLFCYNSIAPRQCGICQNICFFESYKCKKCNFLCHKKCTPSIFFSCRMTLNFRDEYDKPHVLCAGSGLGLFFCDHCGERIGINAKKVACSVCKKMYHQKCEPSVFSDCGFIVPVESAIITQKEYCVAQTMSIKDFSLVKVLGRGSFGKVMLASHKEEKAIYAIKILKKERIVNANNFIYLELERHVLDTVSRYKHPFLMQMKHCFQDAENIYFCTEYLAGGDLLHHIAIKTFSHNQNKLWVSQIVLGLEFLHSKNIVYRDLKLDNIMLTSKGNVKIADFGLCKEAMNFNTVTFTYCGTLDTIAPEVINQKGYTKDCDWWSLGIVIYELYESDPPFFGETVNELTQSILNDEIEFKQTPKDAQDLIIKLLERNPKLRLGNGELDAKSVKEHLYFKDIDFNKVFNFEYENEFVPGDKLANFDEEFTELPITITPSPSVSKYDKFFANFK